MTATTSQETPLERCLDLLRDLIGYRTINPGGDERAICEHLAPLLEARGADAVMVADVPRAPTPGAYVFATWGTPRLVINVHVDTVPVNSGWTRDPFALTIEQDDDGDGGGRAYGLGTADTKGAIAAVLVALDAVRPTDVGVLLSGDEETGARCMEAFLASEHVRGVERAIVCEPTARRAGIRHRGVLACRARLRGRGGHSSAADTMPAPIVAMSRLALALDEIGRDALDRGPDDMRGLCMNVAGVDGGVAFNVVPEQAQLIWSLRPPPGFDRAGYDAAVEDAIARVTRDSHIGERGDTGAAIAVEPEIDQPPFQCADVAAVEALVGPHVTELGTLAFWTEAALWAQAGVHAVVCGPGDIRQAHGADEYVALADLSWAIEMFADVLSRTRGEAGA